MHRRFALLSSAVVLASGCGQSKQEGGSTGSLTCDEATPALASVVRTSLREGVAGRVHEVRHLARYVETQAQVPEYPSMRGEVWIVAATVGDDSFEGPMMRFLADRDAVTDGSGVIIALDTTTDRLSKLGIDRRTNTGAATLAKAARVDGTYAEVATCARGLQR